MKIQKLERHEVQSALWERLKAHLETELNNLRKSNDGIGNDAVQTAFIRGRIAQTKALLALGNPDPAQVADDAQ